jgi:hypothetical protein
VGREKYGEKTSRKINGKNSSLSFSDTSAKMYKITRIAGEFVLEKYPAAKILKVRVAFPRK